MTSKNFKTRVRIFSFPFYRAIAKTTRNVLDLYDHYVIDSNGLIS